MKTLYELEIESASKWLMNFKNNLEFLNYCPLPCDCPYDWCTSSHHENLDQFIKWMYDNEIDKINQRYSRPKDQLPYFWMGINPPIGTYSLSELYKKFELFLDKYSYSNAMFAVEQNTENGIRPHIHAIIITHKKKHRVIEQIEKYFKIPNNSINIESYKLHILQKINYIKGIKTESKQSDVDQDKLDRENLGINQFYSTLSIEKNSQYN